MSGENEGNAVNQEVQEKQSHSFFEGLDLENAKFVPQDGYIDDPAWKNTEPVKEEKPITEKKTDKTEPEKKDDLADFDFVEKAESGESIFSTAKALDFMKPTETRFDSKPSIAPPPPPPVNPPAPEPKPEDTMYKNLLTPLDMWEDYINAGIDLKTARLYVERDIKAQIDEHNRQQWQKGVEEQFKAKEKAIDEKSRVAELRPLSHKNMMSAVTKGNWGTVEKFQQALFHKDLAGGFLTKMFERENPGKKYSSVDEYTTDLGNWFTKASADPETLAMLEEVARAKIIMRNLPKLLEHNRAQKDKVEKQNSAANVNSDNKNKHTHSTGGTPKSAEAKWIEDLIKAT
jgi:hypothetical protein